MFLSSTARSLLARFLNGCLRRSAGRRIRTRQRFSTCSFEQLESRLLLSNVAPVIGGFGGTVNYVEGTTPVVLDPGATLMDPDSPDFQGGFLRAIPGANWQPDDRLSIRNQGNGAGQVGLVGNFVLYGQTVIGTLASSEFRVNWNFNATPQAVQAVLRNITFQSLSHNPSTLPRTVQILVTDGDGGTSNVVTETMTVTPVNDPPIIGAFGGVVGYTPGGPPVLLDSDATVTDVDSPTLNGGKLQAAFTANQIATDRLSIRNQGTAAGQIGITGSNVTYGGTVIGTLAPAAFVVSLNSQATPAAVQALVRNILFSNTSGSSSTNRAVQVRMQLSDGTGGTSIPVTKTVNFDAPPVIGGFGGTVTYTENAAAVILDDDATVTDVDSANFDTGKLVVTVTANGEAADRIWVNNQGNAAGQIGVSGNKVYYGGTLIGTIASNAFVVTLNANATPAAAQQLLRNVTYRSISENPSTAPRTVTVSLDDGDGGTSSPVTKTVNVIAVNDPPVVGNFGGSVTYIENSDPAFITTTATVTDVDSTNFDTGKLVVTLTAGAETTDRIWVNNQGTAPGQIGVSNNQVTYGGTLIGTIGGNAFAVTLNANATPAAAQALLRNVVFYSVSQTPSTAPRTVQVRLSDDQGATSTAVTKTINVQPFNNPPVITGFGGSVTYLPGSAFVLLDTDAVATDVDSPNFDTGRLIVEITANAQASDRIWVNNQGSGGGKISVSGNVISYGGVAIGTIGSNAFVVTFNANATPAAVTALIRNLTYRNISASPSTAPRTVRVILDDGGGALSLPVTKTVNIGTVVTNSPPTIGNFGGSVDYTVGGPPVILDSDATVTDTDSADFMGGALVASLITNQGQGDRLSINNQGTGVGQIGLSGNNVTYEGIVIGTLRSSAFVVDFNIKATPVAVQALIQNITFSNTLASPSLLPRTVQIKLTDGDGPGVAIATKSVNFV